MDVLDSERVVGGISFALVVFSRTEEEEESDPGKVADGLLIGGSAMIGGVQDAEVVDGYGEEYFRRRAFLIVDRELLSHPKVDFPQPVVMWVVGSHSCK